jgi:hypothetical protein
MNQSSPTEGYTEDMLSGMQFLWNATRGYRLKPWRSPYLRWRLETYSGKKAETLKLKDFWDFLVSERGQIRRFSKWLDEMHGYAESSDQG